MFFLQVLVPFLIMVQVSDLVLVPVPVLVPDQTWSRSLVPVPSYFWSRPWSRSRFRPWSWSRSRHISGSGLGPGPSQNLWSCHTVRTVYSPFPSLSPGPTDQNANRSYSVLLSTQNRQINLRTVSQQLSSPTEDLNMDSAPLPTEVNLDLEIEKSKTFF